MQRNVAVIHRLITRTLSMRQCPFLRASQVAHRTMLAELVISEREERESALRCQSRVVMQAAIRAALRPSFVSITLLLPPQRELNIPSLPEARVSEVIYEFPAAQQWWRVASGGRGALARSIDGARGLYAFRQGPFTCLFSHLLLCGCVHVCRCRCVFVSVCVGGCVDLRVLVNSIIIQHNNITAVKVNRH